MKNIILPIFLTIILLTILSPSKSFSQEKWKWSDSVICKNADGSDLLIYFLNGQTMNDGRENYAFRIYNHYNLKLFVMWTVYFDDSTTESYGDNIESDNYLQFGISSPVKSIIVTKYEKP